MQRRWDREQEEDELGIGVIVRHFEEDESCGDSSEGWGLHEGLFGMFREESGGRG